MKRQSLFSVKNKKDMLSAELAQKVVKVKEQWSRF